MTTDRDTSGLRYSGVLYRFFAMHSRLKVSALLLYGTAFLDTRSFSVARRDQETTVIVQCFFKILILRNSHLNLEKPR